MEQIPEDKRRIIWDQRKPLSVVLVSGGMDSLLTAGMASDNFRTALIHFNYGQRTEEAELRAFKRIADYFEVPEKFRLVIYTNLFSLIGASALTDTSIKIENSSIPEINVTNKKIPFTYVPFRNSVLLSMSVSWAEAISAKRVFYGAVWADSSGYPDCRKEYVTAFNALIPKGTRPDTEVRVETPLIDLKKVDIVKKSQERGLPLHLTWSCYQNNMKACGICESCQLRKRGFEEAGMKDPITYMTKEISDPGKRIRIDRLQILMKALVRHNAKTDP